ncbi:MAG TPA: VOC family protein [Acidimicrobiia bacterium]|nr:VOC family protein [Acidimicrobiia bacterium]
MLNFSNLMIGSSEPKVLADFYKKVLDTEPEWADGDWFGFKIGAGSIAIGPHSEVQGTNKEPGRLMLNIEADDPKAEFDRIKAAGAQVIADPYEAGDDDNGSMTMSTFADPDGNYFQICSKREG